MNRFLPLAAAMTFFLATGLFAQTEPGGSAAGAGKIQVVDTHDWGKASPGTLVADIKISNVGDGPLKIDRVKPSCGCTAAPLDKDVLQPGESTMMHVSVDIRRDGPLRKSLTIYSNDPAAPTTFVQLRADIVSDLQFRPDQSYILLNNPEVGVATMQTIKVSNTSEAPVTLHVPELTEGNVDFEAVGFDEDLTLAPGESSDLVFSITPKEQGTVNGELVLKTSSATMPERQFRIWGQMQQ